MAKNTTTRNSGKAIIGKVYCEYDAKIVFMHKNGSATIEPICMHPELEGKIPSVDAFSYEYVQYHHW